MKEFVFVLKRRDLFEASGPLRGFRPLDPPELEESFLGRIRRCGFFLERDRAERDPDFKQIIPYTLVLSRDRVFAFRRLEAQAEARLRRKSSIGIGGHVEVLDAGPDPVRTGCLREIAEELAVDGPVDPEPVGVLNDEENDVGAVHFGVVHRLRVDEARVRVREVDRISGDFVGLADLRERARRGEDFETWTRLLLGALDGLVDTGAVAGRHPAGGELHA
ncbi:MAG TPA: phosphoesterase [Planctomycetota bacterium]|nr:phosphoesterase [Planctomycetota bacterium]